MSLICNRMAWYVIPMYSCAICVSLAFTPIPSVSRSYVLVCYSYVTRMYSYVTRVSWYVLVCHPHVTRVYSYVIRMSLVCGLIINQIKNP